ncbi:hypothetical protein BDP27DRAFT_1341711 [Rhodocollybia butyracea]|uniref:F-box domain-containing protein n=1 Tax=Rhodocollybia butyracea TaxID=206335 RepID=A0A9P5PBZ4_9AGAR|nr:hypothetical protein BDP27DRAFT_1341711 [Rhodocollybia butyracea]
MSFANHDEPFDVVTTIEKLRTWYYPATVGELSRVMVTQKMVQDDIADHDEKLDQLHTSYDGDLERLLMKRDCLSSSRQGLIHYAEKLSGLLSPIRRVPNEILCQIFLYCCTENDMTNGKPGEALTLSSVCTRFREVAISSPALWSNLTALFPAAEHYDYRNRQQETKLSSLIQLYLDRSKDRPLTLDLNIEERYHLPNRPSLQLLTREFNRWKHLVLRGYSFSTDPLCPSRDCLPSPSLESLEFRYGVVNYVLDLTNNWKSLTHLRYPTTLKLDNFWRALELCTNLHSLTVQALKSSSRILPTLSSLAVINCEFDKLDDSLECIISSLTTPNLSELVLEQRNEGAVEYPRQSFHHINGFFERSQLCSLTSLVIQGLYISDRDMVALLLQVSSLETLSIHDPAFPDLLRSSNPISKSFIESLHAGRQSAFRPSVEPLLPKLRELTLKVTAQGFDPSSFVDTIASRWLPDQSSARELGLVCLRSVELHLPGTVDTKPYELLRQFDEAGLRVVVKYRGVDGYIV